MEGCFYFSLIWSVGACVDGEGRRKFDAFLRHAMAGTMESTPEYEDFKIKVRKSITDNNTRTCRHHLLTLLIATA